MDSYQLFLTAFVRWTESAIHDSLAGVPPVDGKQTVIVGPLEALRPSRAIALIRWLNLRPRAGEKVFRTVEVRAAGGPICVELSRRTKLFEPQSRLLSHHRLQ